MKNENITKCAADTAKETEQSEQAGQQQTDKDATQKASPADHSNTSPAQKSAPFTKK